MFMISMFFKGFNESYLIFVINPLDILFHVCFQVAYVFT